MVTLPSVLLERGFYKLGGVLGVKESIRKPHMTDTMVFTLFSTNVFGAWWVEAKGMGSGLSGFLLWFAAWRITDIVCTAARIVLFDPYKTHYTSEYKISSTVRSIILGFINYIELILAFAVIYCAHIEQIGPKDVSHDPLSALYLSAVTQMTVGYGDLQPIGSLRLVASLQAFIGLAFISLFVARFISLLRPVQSLEEEDEA